MAENKPIIAACYAKECEYNENLRCNAQLIEIDPSGQEAFCQTFETEEGETQ